MEELREVLEKVAKSTQAAAEAADAVRMKRRVQMQTGRNC